MKKKRPTCVAMIDAECPRVDSCGDCEAGDSCVCKVKTAEMCDAFFTVEEMIEALEKKIEKLGGGYKQKVISFIRDIVESAKLYHDLSHPDGIVSKVEITHSAYRNLVEIMKQLADKEDKR